MQVDRFGKPLRVGFADFELEYFRAAMTLPMPARLAAFQDIADMTGRGVTAVRTASYDLRRRDLEAIRVLRQRGKLASAVMGPKWCRLRSVSQLAARKARRASGEV